MSLKSVFNELEKIAQYSGRKDKEKIIENAINSVDYFREVVYYTLHPFIQFNTKHVEYIPTEYYYNINDIFMNLDYLSRKRGATDEDIYRLCLAASIDKETVEVVRRIINKDLECGANIKTFKKFIPEIPEVEIMRCESDLEKFLKQCRYNKKRIIYSPKLDGVRCTTLGNGIYLSRSGKEFPNFNVFDDEITMLKNELSKLEPNTDWNNIAIDGEVVAVDKEFQDLMTQIRRLKDVDPSKFKFFVFDIIHGHSNFLHRYYDLLLEAFKNISPKKIALVPHREIYSADPDKIKRFANKMINIFGYEGLVLKDLYSEYERKRSKSWCKMKKVYTADVQVDTWEYGRKKNKDRIGNFICSFKDETSFAVGSGLTEEEREYYMESTPSIIEIEYQELTKDGKPRFPVFKRVREDKNEID